MREMQGHYWGRTWVGATHCSAVSATADAALVAPTHVLLKTNTSTGPVLAEYKDWPQSRLEGGQQ